MTDKNQIERIQPMYVVQTPVPLPATDYDEVHFRFMQRQSLVRGFEMPAKTYNEFFGYFSKKENYYITAIDNLLKKTEFLQLTIQFDEKLITENEFETELKENESKYLIKMNATFPNEDFNIITEIASKLNREFSDDEISELFSIPLQKTASYYGSLNSGNQ